MRQRFDVGRSVYHHFFTQAVIPDGAWEKVEGLLHEASHGTIKYDPQHFEWNFGFNLMSVHHGWRVSHRLLVCGLSRTFGDQ